MKFQYTIMVVFLLAISQGVWAQSKKKNSKGDTKSSGQPSSLNPYYPEQTKNLKKTTKVKSKRITYDARDKFYDRMEQVAKDNRKAEKELQKPQYSDPSYFGHKRPPKRRPAGRLKYCKECGIRH